MLYNLLERLKKLKAEPDSLREQEIKNIEATIVCFAYDMDKRIKHLEMYPNSAGRHEKYKTKKDH